MCWAWGFPPLEDVDERLGTMSTVTCPSWHRTRPPPRPAPGPTPRPSSARPLRVAQGQWPKRAEDVSKTVPGPAASTTGSKSAKRDDEDTVRVGPRRVRSGQTLRVLGLQIAYLEVI